MTKKLFTVFMLFVMCLLIPRQAGAIGDLTITPWRVVFGPRDRSATIELLNTSNVAGTYRMGWMMTKATAAGKYEDVFYKQDKDKVKDPHIVPNMVIYSPRQVTVESHGEQVVRLSLRRPADLPPGEYRAHVTFTKMADQRPVAQDPHAKTVSMELNVNYGFSIPVIVRQGEDRALKISIQSPKMEPGEGGGTILMLDLHRDAGKFSSYGELEVYWKPSKGGEVKVGSMTNIAVYPEVQTRHIAMPLLRQYTIVGGTLRIVYKGALESEGTTWAEKSFPVGGGK